MIHEVLPLGPLQCNCSIFGDELTREALVFDPGDDVDGILRIVEKHGLRVKAIVITHAHIDHIGAADELRTRTGAPVWMNPADAVIAKSLAFQAAWLGMREPKNPGIDFEAKEGDTVSAGATAFHVLHTPGHTPGSISLYAPRESKVVAGDTLFFDTVGRTDLPGGSSKQIHKSIQGKLFQLPGETVVIPGHGQPTTIDREKRLNPFVRMP